MARLKACKGNDARIGAKTMKILWNWTAKRAGGRITIYATDPDTGQPCRVVGVDKVEGGKVLATSTGARGPVIATDKHGYRYQLI